MTGDHSYKSYCEVLFHGDVYRVVLTFESMDEILKNEYSIQCNFFCNSLFFVCVLIINQYQLKKKKKKKEKE